jgi:hypothetical protein
VIVVPLATVSTMEVDHWAICKSLERLQLVLTMMASLAPFTLLEALFVATHILQSSSENLAWLSGRR